ncbi:hypothetical protein [Bartonella vinsonii]|uniref:hypothetical protein n=1 Tax=Bartonella vinsonii TaxID=33047 RepID=UPI000683DA81|nr:hypothetical protein [Bartonella vinsonii]
MGKAGAGGFDITVKRQNNADWCLDCQHGSNRKNSLTTGSITARDIINSAHVQTGRHSTITNHSTYGITKNVAKNVLNHGKTQDTVEEETKSAISTIIIIDEAGKKTLMGQGKNNRLP